MNVKKILSLLFFSSLVVCSFNVIPIFAMSDHYETVSYGAGGYGYTSANSKNEYATQYSTRLTGVGFNGLPAGQFPSSSTNIYFTPCDAERGYAAMAPRNYHNSTHVANATVKHDSNYSLSNTVGVKWNFGYKSSLP